MPSKRILVLDENAERRKLNAFGLRCAGFAVDEAVDSSSARSCIANDYPDAVLIVAAQLDFTIQDFVRTLRGASHTRELPLLILVERDSELGAACALHWGVDDYMVEPISPEGFVARVRASLARRGRAAPIAEETTGLSVDSERRVVRKGNHMVPLGRTEWRLLEFFLMHPEQLIPRDLLLFRIWGAAANLQSRVLDVSVCRLRRALRELGCAELLQTVSQRGYKFVTSMREGDIPAYARPTGNDNTALDSCNTRSG
jgi:two-component system phosphate regulon response regulator PhoB